MNVGELFAGIGELGLGMERAGHVLSWQVEIDPYARRVLEKNFPTARRWDDVRTFPPDPKEDWAVDIITGGFPCQDISCAGKGRGLTGEKSGLWFEMLRIIRLLRPRFVIVENVPALTTRGLGSVLGGLSQAGYDAEWRTLSAQEFGAPHIRERLFIIAYTNGDQLRSADRGRQIGASRKSSNELRDNGETWIMADSPHDGALWRKQFSPRGEGERLGNWWAVESELDRVANGIPARMDRLRCLGNAVVPQVAEYIGRLISAL